jgi:hypothetical protein
MSAPLSSIPTTLVQPNTAFTAVASQLEGTVTTSGSKTRKPRKDYTTQEINAINDIIKDVAFNEIDVGTARELKTLHPTLFQDHTDNALKQKIQNVFKANNKKEERISNTAASILASMPPTVNSILIHEDPEGSGEPYIQHDVNTTSIDIHRPIQDIANPPADSFVTIQSSDESSTDSETLNSMLLSDKKATCNALEERQRVKDEEHTRSMRAHDRSMAQYEADRVQRNARNQALTEKYEAILARYASMLDAHGF